MAAAAGKSLRFGDKIRLYDKQLDGYLCADGFTSTTLTCKNGAPDTSCIFEICCKQSYQQLKRYKKVLNKIGISAREELEAFRQQENVDDDDANELAELDGGVCDVDQPGGRLEKEMQDNSEEVARQRGQLLKYGTIIQLRHVNSNKYIVLSKEAGLQPGSSKLEVDRAGGEGSWIKILPGFKVRKEGEDVSVSDQAKFQMLKKSTPERPLFVHTNGERPEEGEGALDEGSLEVNAMKDLTQYEIKLYAAFDQGDTVLCSGDTLRLQHMEEQGFLVHGQVWSADETKGQDKRRIHILSQVRATEVAMACSNALWEVEQMDVTSIDALTEKAQSGQSSEPQEFGGNGTWEKLYRLKHKGTGEYMAASFDSSASTDAANPRGPVRIYFTALRKERAFREAHLETLWAIKPVNPKDDLTEPILIGEGFHIQHAATCYWIHAKSAEGSDLGKYYDDPPPDGPARPTVLRAQRMIEMVAEKPYADAFGLNPTDAPEVLDINMALKLKPQLEKYASMLEHLFSPDNSGEEVHPRVPQAKAQPVIDLLTNLILRFLVPPRSPEDDLDPLTREGPIDDAVRRRQQLLREQGFLDIIVRMTSAQSAEQSPGRGVKYEDLQRLEPNVFKVCKLCNAVAKNIVNSNTANCMHMKQYIRNYIDQTGFQLGATDVLLKIHKDNKPLLESLEVSDFRNWIDVMKRSIDEDKIDGRLDLAAWFLSATCVCAADQSSNQKEDTGIKRNQDMILDCLFDGGEVEDKCVVHLSGKGQDIKAKLPLQSENFVSRDLETIFSEEDADGQKRTKKELAVQDFFVFSIELYANLCSGRNGSKKIERIKKLFPEQLVLDVIMTPRKRCCDRLRAQFCNLFVRLYVDCDKYPADEEPIQHTRVWDHIEPVGLDHKAVSDLEEEDFKPLKHWIVQFLSDSIPEEDENMRGSEQERALCCTRMTSGDKYEGRNKFILAVVKLVYKMVHLRCYFDMEPPKEVEADDQFSAASLKDVLKPLLVILDGKTDRQLGPGADLGAQLDGNGKDAKRFADTPPNKILTETKTWICRILNRTSLIRLNVRMSHLLLHYKDAYLKCKDGEKYIRGGSKFKSLKTKPALDRETKDVFNILDFEDKDMQRYVKEFAQQDDGSPVDLDLLLMDLVAYEDEQLRSEALSLLLRQRTQRVECAENLCKVQLLCSRLQIAFLDRGKKLKKQLTKFYNKSPKTPKDEEDVTKTLNEMILTVTLQAKDNDTVVDGDVCRNRQELYKNIGVPQLLLDILRPTEGEEPLPEALRKMIYEFLTLVCKGLEETKQDLKSKGFETFLSHLSEKNADDQVIEVGADKLITELFSDNRKLCTQITNDDIKQFVNLIVTQGRSPKWLGFMNSLVKPDPKGLPIKKNQRDVIKELVANKMKTMLASGDDKPSIFVAQEDWNICVGLMEESTGSDHAEPLRYHVELVSLLCKCAQGKNRAAEELCQQQLPMDAIIRGLLDDRTIPYVKKTYLEFLWESYIEVDRRYPATQFDAEIWKAMERMAADLQDCIDLQYDLKGFQEKPLDEHDKKEKVQYLYATVVWFLDNWFGGGGGPSYYEPDTWATFGGTAEDKDKHAATSTKLLDGVCCLNDPNSPPLPECEITTSQKDAVNVCVYRMMERGVKPSSENAKLAEKLKEKGREYLDNRDMYPPGRPPLTNEVLTQKGLTLFARDLKELVERLEERNPPGEKISASNRGSFSQQGPLVQKLRVLLMDGNDKLVPYGDKNVDQYQPEKYVQRIAAEIVSQGCPNKNKVQLLKLLEDTIVMTPFPRSEGRDEDENARKDRIREQFCEDLIMLPKLIIDVGSQVTEHEIFKAVLKLAVALVGAGHEKVQKKMLELFQKDIRDPTSKTEPFFNALESRLLTAKAECGEAKKFYQQHKDQELAMQEQEEEELAMFANAGQSNAKEILKLTEPPPEKFPEEGYVCDIMLLIQQLCEGNNQAFKEFMQVQAYETPTGEVRSASKSHDLVRSAVEYLEVWEKNKTAHNIQYGVAVFNALSELVIGPCVDNQKRVGEDLKMETVNSILRSEPIEAPDADQARVDTRELKASCVLLLHSMLEGQSKGASKGARVQRRILKALEELKKDDIKNEVMKIYKERVDKTNWKYMLRNRIAGIRPFAWCFKGEPAFEEGQEELAFQMVVLLRKIHDANDDVKRPKQFVLKELENYETPDWLADLPASYQPEQAFRYFTNSFYMGRIEISREIEDKPGHYKELLERVYFRVPPRCEKLTTASMKELTATIDRTSREDKLKEFASDRALRMGYEMALQEFLSSVNRDTTIPAALGKGIYSFLDKYREHSSRFTFYLCYIINMMILLGIDHEDKYDADPSANVASSEGEATYYNIIDMAFIPVRSWGIVEVCEGISGCDKKAYIPQKMLTIIMYLGYTQTVMSTVNFILFLCAKGPMIIFDKWQTRHVENEKSEFESKSNYNIVPFTAEVYQQHGRKWGMCWSPKGKLPYYVGSFWYMISSGQVIYQILYIACTILGNVVSPFFFAFHTMDILSRDPKLMSVLEAIIKPIKTILSTLWLSMVVMYIFTLVGFVIFHDHFNPGDAKQDNLCNSILQCWTFTLYSGIISSEVWAETGISELWPTHPYGAMHDRENNDLRMFTGRFVYDVFFFLFIGVVLIGGVLFGIILDNFTEIRSEKMDKKDKQHDYCFICESQTDELDKEGPGFQPHVDNDHNMWQYLYFIVYLKDLNPEDYNGPESYVADMLGAPSFDKDKDSVNVKWMPNKKSLVLEKEGSEGDSDNKEKLAAQVDHLQMDLAKMKKDNDLTSETVVELLSTLKRMEQNVQ